MDNRSPKEAIAYHGWGFDASCWRDWQRYFEQQGWQFQAFDRGYWQRPSAPKFNPTAQTKLLLVHSYGLHLCPPDQLQQANIMVIFSSFARFHPASEPLKRRSQKILQQMIAQFAVNPLQVLSQFRLNCHHPCAWQATLSDHFDSDLLLHDLNHLQTAEIDLALLQKIPQILIFQGDQDRIVPFASSDEFIEKLLKNKLVCDLANNRVNKIVNVQHQRIETAGHALPFTHFDNCWSKLQADLNGTPYEQG